MPSVMQQEQSGMTVTDFVAFPSLSASNRIQPRPRLLVLLSQVLITNAQCQCNEVIIFTWNKAISMSTGFTPNQVPRFGVKSAGEPDSVQTQLSPWPSLEKQLSWGEVVWAWSKPAPERASSGTWAAVLSDFRVESCWIFRSQICQEPGSNPAFRLSPWPSLEKELSWGEVVRPSPPCPGTCATNLGSDLPTRMQACRRQNLLRSFFSSNCHQLHGILYSELNIAFGFASFLNLTIWPTYCLLS